jgi:hypothetical protein
MHTETTVDLLTCASKFIAACVKTVPGPDGEPEPANECEAVAHDLACALAVEARRLQKAPAASEHQLPALPEPDGVLVVGTQALRGYSACTLAGYAQSAIADLVKENAMLREGLQCYADGNHFMRADEDAWDTVSGEPRNFWCDEAGTATIEDGSVAAAALKGQPLRDEEDVAPSASERQQGGETPIATYHRDDEGPAAAEAYAKIVASVSSEDLLKIANLVAHGARATIGAGRVVLTCKDWDDMKVFNLNPAPAATRAMESKFWTRESAAEDTLKRLGYEWRGGELWAPPVGKRPDFNLIDKLVIERDAAQVRAARTAAILVAIHQLLYPSATPGFTFCPDNANEWMQRLSDRIRAIPDELAKAHAQPPQAQPAAPQPDRPPECKGFPPGACRRADATLCEIFKDKAVVEQALFDAAGGKAPMPDQQRLRELALLLGHAGPLLSAHSAAQQSMAAALASAPAAAQGGVREQFEAWLQKEGGGEAKPRDRTFAKLGWDAGHEAGRQQGMSQANALWEMAKTSEAADKPAALIALNDKTRSDVDEAIRKLRELDGKEVELWQWWAVVCMALWKAYQLGAATTQPTHEQAKAETAKAEQAVPVAWRTDAPASEDEQGRQLDLAREDKRLFGHGVTVNGWRVPAPLVSMLASPPATESRPLTECKWTPDNDGTYWTTCGQGFVFNCEGGPKEHDMRFCCYCAHGITAGTTEQAKEQG